MNAVFTGQKQRWAVSVAVAAAIVVALLYLFRFPSGPTVLPVPIPAPAPATKHAVQLAAPADQLLRDETELRDLRPLFLPTERNARPPELSREPARTLLDNNVAKLSFPETELNLTKDFPPAAVMANKPADQATPLLALASEAASLTWFGIGRAPITVLPVAARGGFVEIVSAATGEQLWGEPLSVSDARVPGDKSWAPLEFLARIDAAGLAAPLVVTTSSGVEEIDGYFRKFLAKTYRLGERLEPGFYRVIVAP